MQRQDSSAQLKDEIAFLNQRLDKIDNHCREFVRLQHDKNDMEVDLRNQNYMQMIEAAASAREQESVDQRQRSACEENRPLQYPRYETFGVARQTPVDFRNEAPVSHM